MKTCPEYFRDSLELFKRTLFHQSYVFRIYEYKKFKIFTKHLFFHHYFRAIQNLFVMNQCDYIFKPLQKCKIIQE